MTASHASDELVSVQTKIENLRVALESSRTIAMAIGIVMERMGCSPEEALTTLRATSQTRNRKLRDLADRLVLTGEIPAPVRKVT